MPRFRLWLFFYSVWRSFWSSFSFDFMYVALRTQLIQQEPWFFEPCFKHLGFLSRDRGYTWDGERHGGPDAYVRMAFDNDRLQIVVCAWLPMGLPELAVINVRRERIVLDLGKSIPADVLENDNGGYLEQYKRVHPLDGAGRAGIEKEFEAAAASRIARFGIFLNEHLNTLSRIA